MPILAMLKDDIDKEIQSPFLPEFDESRSNDLEYRCDRVAEFLCPKISVKSDGIGPKKIICENKNNNDPNKGAMWKSIVSYFEKYMPYESYIQKLSN